MKVLVVYESMFGNTKIVAEAIAEGLRDGDDTVVCGDVDALTPEDASDATLIVAGGPTHAHGMVSAGTRRAAEQDTKNGPALPARTVMRDWIERLPAGTATSATFDTRFDKPKWLTGSAATKIARRLTLKGYEVVAIESFFVSGTGGPLAAGERERATEWGKTLAASLRKLVVA